MDPRGHIYEAPLADIPAEDKARLDGFLRGRAEADAQEIRDEAIDALKERLAKLEQEEGR